MTSDLPADDHVEDESESGWEDELRRGVDDVESGRVHGIPWSAARVELADLIAARRAR